MQGGGGKKIPWELVPVLHQVQSLIVPPLTRYN